MEAHRTLLESYLITSALADPSEILRATLVRLLEGHDTSYEDANSTPRDMQFELLIAALMTLGGISGVRMGEPDIQFKLGKRTVGVAAKRLRSPRKLVARVGDAFRQLERHGLQGMIALNLDSAAEVAFAKDGEAAAHPAVTGLVAQAAKRIDQMDPQGRVIGIVGFATVFAMSDSEDGYGFSLPTSIAMHWRVSKGMEDSVSSFSNDFGSTLTARLQSLLAT
ncbi:MAG: hypothetical protein V4550_09165 [Gemmatimonadota bacterium]